MTAITQHPLCNIFNVSLIADAVLSDLSLADIVALQSVSRPLRHAIEPQRDTRFNFNTLLKHFVNDCESFRRNLAINDALVVGGLVLNFLQTRHRKIDHLDVLVQDGPRAETFMAYLYHEKYTTRGWLPPILNTFGEVTRLRPQSFTFQKESSGLQIRVKTTATFPIHALLQSSYTTAELNFISWNKMYSIFPQITIFNHKFYPLRRLDDDFGKLLSELSALGWTSRDLVWPDLASEPLGGIGTRTVGDRLSAAIPIAPKIPIFDVTPDYVIEHSEFDVVDRSLQTLQSSGRKKIIRPEPKELSIEVKELCSPALLYRYTTGHGQSGTPWRDFAEERLKRWTLIELYKMPQGGRPFDMTTRTPPDHFAVDLPPRFSLPESWDYADDQMSLWYQTYEQQKKVKRSLM